MKIENLIIKVWEDEDCRDQGITYEFSTTDVGCKSIGGLIHSLQTIYDEYVKHKKGSIEVELNDDEGEWMKTLYHISEDSNHIVKDVIGWERESL